MKFLIVGRSAAGKDTLKDILVKEYGWSFVQSYTTRPKRFKEEDTHIFVSEAEAETVSDTDKAAKTVINGYEYFATKEQVEKCDAYIIDPIGLNMLMTSMPNTKFCVVYMSPSDAKVQKAKAISRSQNCSEEERIFQNRIRSEDAQFTNFEKILKMENTPYPNWESTIQFVNFYDMDRMEMLASQLNKMK